MNIRNKIPSRPLRLPSLSIHAQNHSVFGPTIKKTTMILQSCLQG